MLTDPVSNAPNPILFEEPARADAASRAHLAKHPQLPYEPDTYLGVHLRRSVLDGVVEVDRAVSQALDRDLVLLQALMNSARERLHARFTREQLQSLLLDIGASAPESALAFRNDRLDIVRLELSQAHQRELLPLIEAMGDDEVICLYRDYVALYLG